MKVPIVCYCCSWLLSVRVCISLCVFSCDMLMWEYTKVHGVFVIKTRCTRLPGVPVSCIKVQFVTKLKTRNAA